MRMTIEQCAFDIDCWKFGQYTIFHLLLKALFDCWHILSRHRPANGSVFKNKPAVAWQRLERNRNLCILTRATSLFVVKIAFSMRPGDCLTIGNLWFAFDHFDLMIVFQKTNLNVKMQFTHAGHDS